VFNWFRVDKRRTMKCGSAGRADTAYLEKGAGLSAAEVAPRDTPMPEFAIPRVTGGGAQGGPLLPICYPTAWDDAG
jgi:hypothetical protein